MAMTDIPTAPSAAVADPGTAVPAEPRGLPGWLTTSDHKRIGRLYIGTSLVFPLVGGVLGAILAAERLESGVDVVDSGVFRQVYTLHGEIGVFLFLVPLLLGIATFVVPLQVGSPELAFPRAAAAGYWGYVVTAGILLGAYLADGGPSGGDAAAVDLHLLALVGLLLSTVLALVPILATILTMRAPGMTLLRAPAFTWSVLVGGSLTLLTLPVLAARLVSLYVTHHFGGDYGLQDYGAISWFWAVPQVYLLVVPALGIAFEVVPVAAGNRVRQHAASLVVLGLLGVVGIGAWAQVPETFDDLLYVALGLAAVLPPLAALGLLGDTLRRGRPVASPALAMALGSLLLLLLGAVAGGLSAIENLELRGTAWETGQMHLVLLGGGTLGAMAGLWWWAPKLYGRALPAAPGFLAFLAVLGGTLALAANDLVNGLADDVPQGSTQFESSSEALNALGAAGAALLVLGGVVAVGTVAVHGVRRGSGPADPWGGHTLEWSTTSPPPPQNFAVPVPPVTSPTPLLDEVGS